MTRWVRFRYFLHRLVCRVCRENPFAGDAKDGAQRIVIIPDDPSPCPRCHRPRATSKTAINAQGTCWRKPTMQPANVSVVECEQVAALAGDAKGK